MHENTVYFIKNAKKMIMKLSKRCFNMYTRKTNYFFLHENSQCPECLEVLTLRKVSEACVYVLFAGYLKKLGTDCET